MSQRRVFNSEWWLVFWTKEPTTQTRFPFLAKTGFMLFSALIFTCFLVPFLNEKHSRNGIENPCGCGCCYCVVWFLFFVWCECLGWFLRPENQPPHWVKHSSLRHWFYLLVLKGIEFKPILVRFLTSEGGPEGVCKVGVFQLSQFVNDFWFFGGILFFWRLQCRSGLMVD